MVHQKCQKEFFVFQEKFIRTFFDSLKECTLYFCSVVAKGKGLEVGIPPAMEYHMVLDLYIVVFTGFEFQFPFEVDSPRGKEAVIQISVKGLMDIPGSG